LSSLNGDAKPSTRDAGLLAGVFTPPCLRFFAIGENDRDRASSIQDAAGKEKRIPIGADLPRID
jgi:hypothetical protein